MSKPSIHLAFDTHYGLPRFYRGNSVVSLRFAYDKMLIDKVKTLKPLRWQCSISRLADEIIMGVNKHVSMKSLSLTKNPLDEIIKDST